jgi:hypothetical protein
MVKGGGANLDWMTNMNQCGSALHYTPYTVITKYLCEHSVVGSTQRGRKNCCGLVRKMTYKEKHKKRLCRSFAVIACHTQRWGGK